MRTKPLRRSAIAGLLLSCLTVSPAVGQPWPGYRAVDPVALPETLIEEYASGRFVVVVTRRASNEDEWQLLQRAENLYPSAGLVDSAAVEHLRGQPAEWVTHLEEASARPGNRWWWHEWDGTLLPFALTASAVRHYVNRVRDLSASPNPAAEHHPGVEHTARFEYSATVAASEDGGHVVDLKAEWDWFCGPRCALGFTHRRTVVFDPQGRVVAVSGDRAPLYVVS